MTSGHVCLGRGPGLTPATPQTVIGRPLLEPGLWTRRVAGPGPSPNGSPTARESRGQAPVGHGRGLTPAAAVTDIVPATGRFGDRAATDMAGV
jgi:hypothetical protein